MASGVRALLQRYRGGDLLSGRKAAERPDAAAEQLDELAQSADVETRCRVAAHPASGETTVRRLAYDPDLRVSAAIAARKGLSAADFEGLLLRVMAEYTIRRGRERAWALDLAVALMEASQATEETLDRLLTGIPTSHLPRLLARDLTNPAILACLARHPKAMVRAAVAENPHLPEETRVRLVADDNDRVVAAAQAAGAVPSNAGNLPALSPWIMPGAPVKDYDASAPLLLGAEEVETARSFFQAASRTATRILDLGCAAGAVGRAIMDARPSAHYTGLDLSPALLATAKHALPQGRFVQADLRSGIPFPAESFDLVLCWHAVHIVPDPSALLAEVLRVLSFEGRFAARLSCLLGDDDDHRLFAACAQRKGYYLPGPVELTTALATSGLVVEHLDERPAPLPRPAAADAASAAHWNKLLDEAARSGCNTDRIGRGVIVFAGRKVAL